MAKDPTPQQWAASVLQRLGYKQTPGAIQALVGWAKAEGGHYNNSAKYNLLNTTQPAPGAGNTGSQGNIKVYTSWDQGIDATVKTLENGHYGGILAGLKKGDAGAVASAIDKSPWGTHGSLVYDAIGSAKPGTNVQPYGGQPAVPHGASAGTPATPGTPGTDNSLLRRQLVGQFLQQGGVANPQAVMSLAGSYGQAADVPGTPGTPGTPATPKLKRPTGGISPNAKPGDPVVSSKQSVGGQHDTSGLAGYPARDYFAPAGTHAVAPVSGKVIKLSGHDPSQGPPQGAGGPLGWSVYIQGQDGKTYFLTHMGARTVKVGQTVQQGQVIGTVADYDSYGRPSHIHMGISG